MLSGNFHGSFWCGTIILRSQILLTSFLSKIHQLFNSLVDHLRDTCAAVSTSSHNIGVSFTTITGKVDATISFFFAVRQQVDRKQ